MARSTTDARQTRQALTHVSSQLAELTGMSVGQLRERYRELFNEATASRNTVYLRKKLAYRIQELAEGGLSERAKRRVEELNKTTPIRRRFGKSGPAPTKGKEAGRAGSGSSATDEMPADRDPRLPRPGTVLRKTHNGVEHQVKILAAGFEYKGQQYKSLSKVARLITGTVWNGYGFFAGELRAAGGGEA